MFFDFIEQRAYRLAFWAMMEEEQSEELPDKVPYNQKLKDEQYVRQYQRRFEARPVETTDGQNPDGGRRSGVERPAGNAEQPSYHGRIGAKRGASDRCRY